MDVHGHAHLDMISIDLGHLFGLLSNMDHPLLPKIEMVQLVKSSWALAAPALTHGNMDICHESMDPNYCCFIHFNMLNYKKNS